MESKTVKALNLRYQPVAVLWSNEKPEGALQFKEGKWGCVIGMLNAAAGKGKTAAFCRKTFGCLGGGAGLGFGNQYENFPGGVEYFLSNGNKEFCQTEMGKNIAQNMPALEHGERYFKNPEIASKFIQCLPMRDIPAEYVVFKPLEQVTESEEPKNIVFLVRPDELSALVVLSNYAREQNVNVIAPMGAGCHQIGIIPYQEGEKDNPSAVIGLTDISVRNKVEKDVLSFTVPFKMYKEIENNIEGSFVEQEPWTKIIERNK